MMKRILVAATAFASVASLATTASAATTVTPTATFNITGNVQALCSTGNLPTGSTTVPLGQLNAADGTLDPTKLTDMNVPLGTMWCNGANSTVEVTATPITTPTTTSVTGFTNRIDNTLSATLNNASIGSLDTLGKSLADTGAVKVGIFSGSVAASASSDSSNNGVKLVAGDYTGTVTVTVTPLA